MVKVTCKICKDEVEEWNATNRAFGNPVCSTCDDIIREIAEEVKSD